MLKNFFNRRSRIKKLHDAAASALMEGFAQVLYEADYAKRTARRHLRAAEHLLYWFGRYGMAVCEANDQVVIRFVNHLSQCQCPHFRHADQVEVTCSARLFVSYLRDTGIIAAPVHQESKDPELLLAFGRWIRQQRGICDVTLSYYRRHLRELLKRIGKEPSRLNAAMLREFVGHRPLPQN